MGPKTREKIHTLRRAYSLAKEWKKGGFTKNRHQVFCSEKRLCPSCEYGFMLGGYGKCALLRDGFFDSKEHVMSSATEQTERFRIFNRLEKLIEENEGQPTLGVE